MSSIHLLGCIVVLFDTTLLLFYRNSLSCVCVCGGDKGDCLKSTSKKKIYLNQNACLSGLLTCSTGRVRTEEVTLCSALFQSGQSGWFCKQANNLSHYRTLPALLFSLSSSEYVFAWNTSSFSLYQRRSLVVVMLRLSRLVSSCIPPGVSQQTA